MNRVLIGPNMLPEMEQEMQIIKKKLKKAHDKQKSYADKNVTFK